MRIPRSLTKPARDCVIDLMPDQFGVQMGGTMRLGAYPCSIRPGTVLERAYGEPQIRERHRHRFEFNNAYRAEFEQGGMIFSGSRRTGAWSRR